MKNRRNFYPERFTADPAGAPAVDAKATEWIAEIRRRIDRMLDPGPYFLGESFSVCDLYLHTMARWTQPHHEPLTSFPKVARTVALVEARPAVPRMLDVQGGV